MPSHNNIDTKHGDTLDWESDVDYDGYEFFDVRY